MAKKQHIRFVNEDDGQVLIYSNKEAIGKIEWYPKWRQWVFSSLDCFAWSADCLECVIKFIRSRPTPPKQ